MIRLCYSCKELREAVYVDPIDRCYCADCVVNVAVPIGSAVRAMQFLALTIPFQVGDRVEARTAGEFLDGVGTVVEIDMDLTHGGTPVYPMFRVVIDEKADEHSPDEGWYTECCLTRVNEPELVEQ